MNVEVLRAPAFGEAWPSNFEAERRIWGHPNVESHFLGSRVRLRAHVDEDTGNGTEGRVERVESHCNVGLVRHVARDGDGVPAGLWNVVHDGARAVPPGLVADADVRASCQLAIVSPSPELAPVTRIVPCVGPDAPSPMPDSVPSDPSIPVVEADVLPVAAAATGNSVEGRHGVH